jgi:phosphoribosylanthranilate isomerase
MRVRVKVCGIRSKEEALWAVEAGASAVGLVFAPSPRQVTPEEAEEICRGLPPFVSRVGVFVNQDPSWVREVAERCGLDGIQLHGEEDPLRYRIGKGVKIIKAVRVGKQPQEEVLAEVRRQEADAVLLDTKIEDAYGGTGVAFDWRVAAFVRQHWPGPLILAGGLNASNVGEAIRLVRPYAVDVSSSVERGGRKDRRLIGEFIASVVREAQMPD